MWQSIHNIKLTKLEQAWLSHRGSLTLKMQQHWQKPLQVKLLHSGLDQALLDEATCVDLGYSEVFCREVILEIDGCPLVAARSVCSPAASRGPLAWLSEFGAKSLAEPLFVDGDGWHRGEIQVSQVILPQGFAATNMPVVTASPILARRSVFTSNGAELLVKEAFLPSFWTGGSNRDSNSS